jgi:hypothetical protein
MAADKFNWLIGEGSKLLNFIDECTTGFGYFVRDDFSGNDVDETKWILIQNTGGACFTTDDDTNGGAGALIQETDATGGDAHIYLRKIPIGTTDFRFAVRCRKVTANIHVVGIDSSTTAEKCYFQNTSGTWYWHAGSSSGSTGVAVSTSYQKLDIVRVNGTVYFKIDGTEVHSQSFTVDIAAGTPGSFVSQGSLAACEVRVDSISFAADR